MNANTFSVTTALLVAGAAFVAYIRTKNWLDSNVPIFFYVGLLAYARFFGDNKIPMWLILAGFGLTLLLRFEFMSTIFIRITKVLEYVALAGIIYFGIGSILS
jgi:hypothetical protein